MACYSQTGLLQSLDILYKIQYTRVEGDVYAIALHETSLLSVYLLVRGLYFYLHTRFSCHRLPKLYANQSRTFAKRIANRTTVADIDSGAKNADDCLFDTAALAQVEHDSRWGNR